MRIILLLLLLSICIAPAAAAQNKRPVSSPAGQCPRHSKLDDEQRFADFVIRTYVTEDLEGCIQVLRNNRIVFSKHTLGKPILGNDINKGGSSGDFHPTVIPLGTDITGLGKPDLIVGEWSGGAHCCYAFYIIELDDRPREIAAIRTGDSDYAHFEDVDHDGIYEFISWDFVFGYWHTSFNGSPAPRIILRRKGTAYVLALDLMYQPPPSLTQLNKTEAEVRNAEWKNGYPPPLLWGKMLDLIYTGHPDLAGSFLDAAWAAKYAGKKQFQKEFCQQLAKSSYFSELRRTISKSPCNFNLTAEDKHQ